jgi:hypothetical protein
VWNLAGRQQCECGESLAGTFNTAYRYLALSLELYGRVEEYQPQLSTHRPHRAIEEFDARQ